MTMLVLQGSAGIANFTLFAFSVKNFPEFQFLLRFPGTAGTAVRFPTENLTMRALALWIYDMVADRDFSMNFFVTLGETFWISQ